MLLFYCIAKTTLQTSWLNKVISNSSSKSCHLIRSSLFVSWGSSKDFKFLSLWCKTKWWLTYPSTTGKGKPEYNLFAEFFLFSRVLVESIGISLKNSDPSNRNEIPILGKTEGRGEECDRGWDGWMASSTHWTCVWANSGRWWRTGKPGMLQSVGMQSRMRLSNWTTNRKESLFVILK